MKALKLLTAISIMAFFFTGCKPKASSSESELAFDPAEISAAEPVFKISTTQGDMTIKLYADTPRHRENFIKLTSKKFYDGILFHRVINGFMIQTGDPLTKDPSQKASYGTGGPGYTIPAEMTQGHHHKKGAIAAARRGDAANPLKESSGSQFYIVQSEEGCSHLDGEYSVFGEVVEGLDVIDKIAAIPTDGRDRPTKDVKIISITPVAVEAPATEAPAEETPAE